VKQFGNINHILGGEESYCDENTEEST